MRTWRMPLRLAAMAALATAVAMAQEPLSSQVRRGGRLPSTTWIDGREAVEGEVIVRYRSETGRIERERAEFQADADEVEPIGRRGARRMRSRRLSTRELLQTLQANPDIDFVEPNYIVRVGAVPNEPWFSSLWGLLNTGQLIGSSTGVVGADISATQAWDVSTGSRATVVGVIDSGIDYNHPDLAANIWTAPRAFTVVIGGMTITCAAGTHGFNAITNTCNPMDDEGHGTHVAGTVGAVGNNGFGIAGVNWTASMMGLKFLNASGVGTLVDAIESIEFAIQAKAALGADANVRILSNSWGGGGFSQALKNQIDAANTADMLFVAAAGNSGSNNDSSPLYPSSYASDNLVSVAATTNRDQLASFSNFGVNSVDLGAPGQSILSTVRSSSYAVFSGTSMATPHVSGAAALVLAVCQRSTAELKSMLLTSVDPVAALSGRTTTGGRLNVAEALAKCFADPPALGIQAASGIISVTVNNAPGNPKDWLALYCPSTNADTSFTASKYLNNSATPPSSGLETAIVTFPAPAGGGTCNARLFLDNGWFKVATSDDITIVVQPPSVTVTNASVNPGAPLNVVTADGPANATDWIGVFATGAPDSPPLKWSYLNGSNVPPATGLAFANLSITAPATGGTYNVRLFANNTYTKLATSNTVTVASPPALTINDVSVAEGHAGSSNATFTVTLSPANASQAVTVAYATGNGTALAGSDYTAASGTLTFAPTVTTQTLTVPVNGDTLQEPNETFVVTLSSAANAGIADAQGVATIVNDDIPPQPSITLLTPSAAPGGVIQFAVANGPGTVTDWVALHHASAGDNSYIDWMYLSGTRVAPSSGLSHATLQFTAPTTPGTYNVRLFLQNGFTKLATSANATVALQPNVSIGDVTVTEGHSGPTVATFTVSVNPVNTAQAVTVDFATANGSASANSDYLPASGTLTFPPSTGSQTLTVIINGDITPEQNETFVVNLSNAANAVIGDPSGTATIIDDDAPAGPSVTATNAVGPGGTIEITVANGPANPTDWIALFAMGAGDMSYLRWVYLNGTNTPPAIGLGNATIQIPAPPAPGTYNVRLFANNGFTKLATSGPITVASQPTLAIGDVTITEGNAGTSTATFTVTLNPVNAVQTVTVDFATANGSATAGSGDYAATTGTLTFDPSIASRTIDVSITGDTASEGSETFVVNLSNAVNALVGDAQGLGTIIDDDGPPAPAVTAPVSVTAGSTITVVVQNGPANAGDWVGLHASASNDQTNVRWLYLNGTNLMPLTGQPSATLNFPAPLTPGAYQFRFFANNGYTRLATSAIVTVTP